MTVRQLLEGRDTKVVTVQPGTALTEAASILTAHRIGALVVTDDAGRLIGIISERDLTRAIAEHAENLFARRVEDVMTRTVATCSPDDSFVEVLYLMNARHIRHVPILEGGALVGMVSVRDVTGEWLALLERENTLLRDRVGAAVAGIA